MFTSACDTLNRYPGVMEVSMPESVKHSEKVKVLCVDLDGTLIRSDLLLESICLLAKSNPFLLLALPLWLSRGKAYMKRRIAEQVSIDPSLLPYHEEFLEYLRAENDAGRRLILGTASDKLLVDKVAGHLGIFEDVLASDGETNVSGVRKRDILVQRYGKGGFAYAGNHSVDIFIWKEAGEGIVVGNRGRLMDQVTRERLVSTIFGDERNSAVAMIKALRVHQWVKNLLLFVPLVMAHVLLDATALSRSASAFLAFCLCSSSVYLINDLVDLEADRRHRDKCKRPFASGDLSIGAGLVMIPCLLLASALISVALPLAYIAAIGTYFFLTFAYSFVLKQIALVDIIALASLYTIRIIAGGYAAGVTVSEWLLAFAMFFFLSLACVKRFAELRALRLDNGGKAHGRGYHADDLELIARFGTVSGYISVLVLALYVNSNEVTVLYTHPRVLWLICPLILYWISRIWLLAERGELSEDPIVFALEDKASYLVGLLSVVVLFLAA